MKIQEIMKILEKQCPLSAACSWDNPGLLVGDAEAETDTVYIALDATDQVIRHAAEKKAGLLLTHHPMIFDPVKKVTADDFIGRRIIALIRQNTALISMHTNFDVYGMADLASEMLGLISPEVLDPTEEHMEANEIGLPLKKIEGIGRVGDIPQSEMTLKEYAEFVKQTFGVSHVKVFGDPDAAVHRAAICPGSGKSDIGKAVSKGADVYVTGDIDHHSGIDAVAQGLNIIDAGHYGIEHIFIDFMADYLQKECPKLTVYKEPYEEPFGIY